MPRILILYATTEGHTAKIARHMEQRLQVLGLNVETHRANALPTGLDPSASDGVIVGGSIHYDRHPRYLRALVQRHHAALTTRPSAFFSVSLSAGGPGARPEAAQRYLETFLAQVDWHPPLTATFAGALRYSKYGMFKKLMMRLIVGMAGGNTDSARGYEYTDWDAVERFANAFTQRLQRTR